MDVVTVLKTINLGKRFKNRWAVYDLNIEVGRGQIFGFLGPNGAGKSTTIRLLLSLISPTDGDFELFGESVKQSGKKIYSKIGALVETPNFYNYLSAERNLRILAELSGGVTRSRIHEILSIVRLEDRCNEKVKDFSHGMRQRLGIAQALLSYPELVILDEPTAGLDPEGMREIRDLILSLSKDLNMTIFLSSHLLHEVEQVCSHMAVIDNGKLVVQGEVRELLKRTGFFVTELHVNNPVEAQSLLEKQRWVDKVAVEKGVLKVQVSSDKRCILTKFLVNEGFEVSAVIPRTSLEDYYISLVQKK